MTDERDDLDRALSAGLADLAPAEPDAASALASMRPRLQRARTRHRVLQGSAVAAVVLVLGVGVALASPSDKRAQVQVTNPPTTQDPADRSRGTSTTLPDSTTLPASTTVPSSSLGVGGSQGGPDATTPNTTPVTTPVTSPATTPSPTAAPDPGSNHTYSYNGGRVVVRFQNGNVSLVSYTPAAGYTAIVHANKPDDVEVRFRKDDTETRVRVRVVDGRLQPETHN
jgi:hypothetical protein